MRRRNWTVILTLAVAAGFAVYGVWGAFVAPFIAVAGYAFVDWRAGKRTRPSDEERFAAFLQAAGETPGTMAVPEARPEAPEANKPAGLTRPAMASKSLSLAVRSGDLPLAIALLHEYSALRHEMAIDAATWHKVGTALLERQAFADAAWALHAAAVALGDTTGAQKRLAEVAGLAAAAGAEPVARGLYLSLVGRYPDSALASFAHARAEALHRRIAGAP